MTYNTIDVDYLKRKFHSRSVTFNNFKEMTITDVEAIKRKIESRNNFSTKSTSYYEHSGLTNYINTLLYLTNPTISQEFKTFDEKIMYLILACDPELETMKTFLSSPITPISSIEETENETLKKELQNKRNQELEKYSCDVRKKIGFYDPKLLKYENILTRTLFRQKGFISGIKVPSLDSLLNKSSKIKNLNTITELNLPRIRSIVERWQVEAKDPSDLNSLAYNLLKRYSELHIFNLEEQIIIFILIADPELNLLKIFEEESRIQNIKERAMNELGFYNKGLINVEQLYHDKFEPDKILSAWTK